MKTKQKKQLTLYDVRKRHLKEQKRKRRRKGLFKLAAKLNIDCPFGGTRSTVNYVARMIKIDKKLKNSIVNGMIVISIASLFRSRA